MSDEVIWVESPFEDTVSYGAKSDEPPPDEPDWNWCPKCSWAVDAEREEGAVAHCEGCDLDFVICAQWELIPCCKEECACPCHERAGYASHHHPDCAEVFNARSRPSLPKLTIPEIVYWLNIIEHVGTLKIAGAAIKKVVNRDARACLEASIRYYSAARGPYEDWRREYEMVAWLLRQACHAVAREPKLLGSTAT